MSYQILQKLSRLFGRSGSGRGAPSVRHNRRRLEFETLEDRCTPTGSGGYISGVAFLDPSGSGFRGATASVLGDVTVTLTGTTSSGQGVNLSTLTDQGGNYEFFNLTNGTYKLGSTSGLLTSATGPIAPNTNFSLGVGQVIVQDIGFVGYAPTGISLRLFLSDSGSSPFTQQQNNQVYLKSAIAPVTVSANSADTTVDLAANFSEPDITNTQVQFKTSAGPLNLTLFTKQTPQTVANFLDYLKSGAYDNEIFHRLVSNFVLQGGGFTFDAAGGPSLPAITTLPAVQNEPGISNTPNTVSLAKVGSNPNSGTSQFFFNLADNSSNLDSQNGGFTVFGVLTSAADQQVLQNLVNSASVQNQSAFNSNFSTIPLVNYNGTNFPTDTTAANYLLTATGTITAQGPTLTYSIVSNSNPALVTATMNNELVNLHYAANQSGTATITVLATSSNGTTATSSFTVTVNPATSS